MMKPAEEAMTACTDDTNLGAENGKLTTNNVFLISQCGERFQAVQLTCGKKVVPLCFHAETIQLKACGKNDITAAATVCLTWELGKKLHELKSKTTWIALQ